MKDSKLLWGEREGWALVGAMPPLPQPLTFVATSWMVQFSSLLCSWINVIIWAFAHLCTYPLPLSLSPSPSCFNPNSDIDTDPFSYRKIMIRGEKKRNFYCTKKCELYTVHLQVEYLFMAKLIFFYPFACACISETGDPNTCWITGFKYFCFHLLCYCFNT